MMKQKLTWEKIAGYGLYAISACMLVLSVFLCFSNDIWYDELFTLGFVKQSRGNLISMTARDVHPPLYYLIVKGVLLLTGTGSADVTVQVQMAKLVSCLAFLFLFLFSFTKIRKCFGTLTAGLFQLLIVSMPQISEYTVEIRMYGLTILFLTMLMVTAYEIALEDSRGKWIVLTGIAIGSIYTHYFAAVSAAVVYLTLLCALYREKRLKKTLLPFCLSAGSCILSYLPWLFSAVLHQLGQVKESYWIQPVSFRTLLGCVKYLLMPAFSSNILNLVLTLIFIAIWFLLLFKNFLYLKEGERKSAFAFACLFIMAGTVLFGMVVSIVMKPIFVYRYMLPAVGCFWLAFSVCFTESLRRSKGRKERALLLGVLLFVVGIGIRNDRAFYGNEMWKRVQMQQTSEILDEIGEGDILIFNFDQLQGVCAFYLPNESYLWYGTTETLITEMYPQAQSLVLTDFTDEEGIEKIEALLETKRDVWFLGSGAAREEIVEKWEAAGMESKEMGDYLLERYWFRLYKIDKK